MFFVWNLHRSFQLVLGGAIVAESSCGSSAGEVEMEAKA